MDRNQPDPHDVPGFHRATGIDDPTPRAEYRDEPPQRDPRPDRDPGRPRAEDLRTAAADELREAANHVESGDADRADECMARSRKLAREARQLELADGDH